jgi:hypothetical protein
MPVIRTSSAFDRNCRLLSPHASHCETETRASQKWSCEPALEHIWAPHRARSCALPDSSILFVLLVLIPLRRHHRALWSSSRGETQRHPSSNMSLSAGQACLRRQIRGRTRHRTASRSILRQQRISGSKMAHRHVHDRVHFLAWLTCCPSGCCRLASIDDSSFGRPCFSSHTRRLGDSRACFQFTLYYTG